MPYGVVNEFSDLIGRITTQGKTQQILERFKAHFASAAGTTSTWSSSVSWAQTDMDSYMRQAADNAPLFLEAFYDACESLHTEGLAVPDAKVINRVLAKHKAGYEIRPPDLISLREDAGPIEVPATPLSIDQQAREVIQNSLSQSEQLLSGGNSRQAVQEVLWLLETVSTAFQGLDIGTGTVQVQGSIGLPRCTVISPRQPAAASAMGRISRPESRPNSTRRAFSATSYGATSSS